MTNAIYLPKMKITSDPLYVTPISIQLKRAAWKVFECIRSILVTLGNLFTREGNRLQRGELLRGRDLYANIQEFEDITCNEQDVIKGTIGVETLKFQENKIAILPYVVKGVFRDHIVLFAVSKREILFYDSKGYSVADYKLNDLYTQITEKVGGEISFFQNTQKEQYDLFNCGVYVYNMIKALSSCDESLHFSNFLQEVNPLTYQEAMSLRQELVEGQPPQEEVPVDPTLVAEVPDEDSSVF